MIGVPCPAGLADKLPPRALATIAHERLADQRSPHGRRYTSETPQIVLHSIFTHSPFPKELPRSKSYPGLARLRCGPDIPVDSIWSLE